MTGGNKVMTIRVARGRRMPSLPRTMRFDAALRLGGIQSDEVVEHVLFRHRERSPGAPLATGRYRR